MANERELKAVLNCLNRAKYELEEAARLARSLGLSTYLHAPIATAIVKADQATAGMERAVAEAATPQPLDPD